MSASTITLAEFKDALSRYAPLIKRLTKEAKPGVLTLEELDKFRYVDAPAQFSKTAGGQTLALVDVQKLVEWKLRHGTYRPTLPKLVASNSDSAVEEATSAAFAHHAQDPSDIQGTLKLLSTPLKGVGPATASLILAIHDPHSVTFFSDEVYRWLTADGKKVSPKYTAAEFSNIHASAKDLMDRLKVTPIEIEKVAYVLIKENDPVKEPKPKPVPSGRPAGRPRLEEHEKKPKKPTVSGRGRGRPPGKVNNASTTKGNPAALTKEAVVGEDNEAPAMTEGAPAKGRGRPSKRAADAEAETPPAKKR